LKLALDLCQKILQSFLPGAGPRAKKDIVFFEKKDLETFSDRGISAENFCRVFFPGQVPVQKRLSFFRGMGLRIFSGKRLRNIFGKRLRNFLKKRLRNFLGKTWRPVTLRKIFAEFSSRGRSPCKKDSVFFDKKT